MSRHRFELWGIDLDERAFAEALAGAGAGNVRNGIVEWKLDAIPPARSASDARAHWNTLGASRIEVQSSGDLDLSWLNATLAKTGGAVYFREDDPEVPVAWEWPLRVGLLEGDRAGDLRSSLDDPALKKLVRFVAIGDEAAECELLLVPCNLRTAVERVLARSARASADCVIVMGGAKVESDRLAPLLRTLRTDVRTAGVAVASVPKEERGPWLKALVANLSRNITIDAALSNAASAIDADPPLLVCSRPLAELTKLANYAERLNKKMRTRSAPKQAPPVRVDAHTSAAEVVEIRENLEATMAEPLTVPRMTVEMATPPMEAFEDAFEAMPMPAPPAERFVRGEFFEQKDAPPAETIEARHAYFLRIRIAPPGGAGAIANVALDESQLPVSESGHDLTIALFELPDGGHEPASPPAQMPVHLPSSRAASSTPAWFPVITPASGTFVARIVVLHQTRVLQTLLLRASVGAAQSAVTITQENVVLPTFEVAETRRPFDAAIVVNEADGAAAVMAMTAKSVAYDQPEDIRAAIDAIAAAITQLTKLADASEIGIDDPAVVAVLITLANQGKILSKWISKKLPPEIAGAERVQIVEAHEGSFLPLEFVYASFAPENDAKICPHGKQELADPKREKCPNERDRKFVCPSVFWGFSRVIERFPHSELAEGRAYRLSTPSPNRTKIEPFQSALVAASSKVKPDDVTGENGVVPAIKPLVSNVFVAGNWNDWMTEIDTHSPSLLVLFPHSEEVDDVAALELGSEFLKYSFLEEPYVRRGDRDPGPIVLLLGCSTNMPRARMQSFVSGFRDLGASIVVATLSLIRGRHATRFVKEFLDALAKRAGKPDAVFGDVLLDAKRRMLAAGDPFALTLVAYGDADWRL